MRNNLISAIAGWKSAALLALVAMVAAVAFSGVLTSTQAEAQDSADHTVNPGGSVTFTVTPPNTTDDPAAPAALGSVVAPATYLGTLESASPTIADGTYTFTFNAALTAAYERATITIPFTGTGIDDTHTETVTIDVIPVEAHPGQTVTVIVAANTALPPIFNITADSTASGTFKANTGRSFVICADDTACDVEDDDPDTDGNQRDDSGVVHLQVVVAEDSATGMIYVTSGTNRATERNIQVTPAPISAELAITPTTPVSISSAADGATEDITATVTTSAGGGVVDVTVVFVTSLGRFTGDCNSLPVCSLKTNGKGAATVSLQGDNRAGAATVTVTAGELSGSKDVTFYGKVAALSAENAGGITAINQGGAASVILTVTDKDGNPVPNVTGIATTSEIEDATGVTATDKAYEGAPGPADDVPSCADGTSAAGQCAVEVAASATATRGGHTVTASLEIAGPPKSTLTDSVDVTVAGASHSISHDAPARIDTLEEIKVSLTVTDDEGNLVGSQGINVTKVEGGGAILDDVADNTANGAASFTFLASSIPGDVVFVVRSGDARAVINVAVGPEPEPVVEEDPAPPTPVWGGPLSSGTHNLVWHGEDGANPSEGALEGVTAIWRWTGDSWQGYFPDAAEVPGGNNLESLENGAAYWVIVE